MEYGTERIPHDRREYGFFDTVFTWVGSGIEDDLKVILPERTIDGLGVQPGDSVVAFWPAAAAQFFGCAG